MFSANHGCAGLTTVRPAFSAAFFTDGEHLVPLVRDILQPPGTIILSPGKVWSEPGDLGMSRASFPFVLVECNLTMRPLTAWPVFSTTIPAFPL